MDKDGLVRQREVEIKYSKDAFRSKSRSSDKIKPIVEMLEQDLRETAGKPFGRGWRSCGEVQLKNGSDALHCHLTHKVVAVWKIIEEKVKIVCKFIYVGSREKAPY